MFSPEPPQGFTSEQSQVVILRQPIPLFSPPQRRRGGPAVETFRVLATYPPAATAAFEFFRFYQIKKGQVPITQTITPLVIIDTLGAGILQEASGLDIRAFDSAGSPLDYFIQEANVVTGKIVVWVNVPTVTDDEFIQLAFGNATATDGQNIPATWPGMDFVYPLDTGNVVTNVIGVDSVGTNVIQVAGKINQAANFVTNADFIAFTSTDWNSQANNSTFSLAYWYKTTDANRGEMFANFTSTPPPDFNLELFNGAIRIFINDSVGFNTDVVTAVEARFNDGQFHLLVFTYGADRKPRLYFDAELILEAPVRPDNSNIFFDPTASTFFAARDSRGTAALNYVGDLELWRKFDGIALDVDEISAMFNNENDNDAFWFKTPILTVSQNNFLVDDLGNNIVTEIP